MMTTFDNSYTSHEADLARSLLILDNYEWIKQQAEAIGVNIIPLKGIDLLQTVYSNSLDRSVRDIDLFCRSEEDCCRLAQWLCEGEYRLEFPFSLNHDALATKRKVSLLSCSPTKVNVDIHIAFVTKKFFSQTIGSFNEDALKHCAEGRMEATDRWLFLAQHAAFHAFSDGKWLRDLHLLLDSFTPEQQSALCDKADSYGFRRVTMATFIRIFMHEDVKREKLLAAFAPSQSEKRFLKFFSSFYRPFDRRPLNRLVASYWEFAFIDRLRDRFRMWCQLMFPSPGMLTNIYRIRKPLAYGFYYPLNLLVSGFTSLLFWITYLLRS